MWTSVSPCQNHVGGVLGHGGAGAHGDADVGAAQRRRVVHPVARGLHSSTFQLNLSRF